VFNIQGGELIFLLLVALVVLGPEKLPDAVRKFGRTYAEFKKVANGFQTEMKSVLDEPMRELRSTADAVRVAANFDFDAEADAGDDNGAEAADEGAAEAESVQRPQRPQRSPKAAPEGATPPRPKSTAKRETTLNFGNSAARAKRPAANSEDGEDTAE
jgi:sec-independent protein translocase protein TatB